MSGRLAGKVAFITGAARGQGRAHAVRLARRAPTSSRWTSRRRCRPACPTTRPPRDDLAQTAKEVEATGRRVLTHQGDVRDLDDMKAFVAGGRRRAFGRLDVVVANAGICIPATWDETTPQVFQDTIDINVTGVWNTVMAGAPHIIAGGATAARSC